MGSLFSRFFKKRYATVQPIKLYDVFDPKDLEPIRIPISVLDDHMYEPLT